MALRKGARKGHGRTCSATELLVQDHAVQGKAGKRGGPVALGRAPGLVEGHGEGGGTGQGLNGRRKPPSIRLQPVFAPTHALLGLASPPRSTQVCEQGGGQVTVLFGTTEGALHLLRLRVPRTPGCGPSDLELLDAGPGAGLGAEEGGLAAWLRPHSGAVAAVDVQPDTQVGWCSGGRGAQGGEVLRGERGLKGLEGERAG